MFSVASLQVQEKRFALIQTSFAGVLPSRSWRRTKPSDLRRRRRWREGGERSGGTNGAAQTHRALEYFIRAAIFRPPDSVRRARRGWGCARLKRGAFECLRPSARCSRGQRPHKDGPSTSRWEEESKDLKGKFLQPSLRHNNLDFCSGAPSQRSVDLPAASLMFDRKLPASLDLAEEFCPPMATQPH